MGRIIRRERAIQDLLELWSYITLESDESRADAFIARIEHRLQQLSDFPQSGRQRNELRLGLRSVPVGRYVVFYVPLRDGIEVVRVLYGGRDLETLFTEQQNDN